VSGTLVLVGFLAGVITAVSPCVLPVLPVVLAGSATGGRWRPYLIVAGLVGSFAFFTLSAAWLLDQLGLPRDFLRDLALVLLFLLAASLIVPWLGRLLERPFLPLTRRRSSGTGSGLLLGLSLGLVYVPCAGPVLAAISALSAQQRGDDVIVLTAAYALGAGLPLLAIAVLGNRAAERTRAFRSRAPAIRRGLGVVIGLTALAMTFNLDSRLQTAVPDYVRAAQDRIEGSADARRDLAELAGGREGVSRAAEAQPLEDFGPAPDFKGISLWLNTPGGRSLSLPRLRGKVVLVDFWTYSCVNCLRTLPHVKAWDQAYRANGLVIVGVHSPEFAFEHVPGNVRAAVERLGVRYPVALDNDFDTWSAYANRYWPAKYLIDRRGHVRFAHFGEGEYVQTERLIRRLLAERPVGRPRSERIVSRLPSGLVTPETYLGHLRLDRYAGSALERGRSAAYALPAELGADELAFGGYWRVEEERAVAGRNARLRLRFRGREVNLVLGGSGRVAVFVDGTEVRTVTVEGSRLYELIRLVAPKEGLLELRPSPGVSAYAFTFA